MRISFVIPGRLVGKGRPRFVRRTGIAFTLERTRSAEAMVRTIAHEAMGGAPLFQGPVSLAVDIQKPHPKSWPAKRKASTTFVTGKPDADNLIKMVGDALNGIVWGDDSQVCQIAFCRKYGASEQAVVTVEDAA